MTVAKRLSSAKIRIYDWWRFCTAAGVQESRTMNQRNITDIAESLQRDAEEKLGHERAEALRSDLQQMAKELHSLDTYAVEYEDEP